VTFYQSLPGHQVTTVVGVHATYGDKGTRTDGYSGNKSLRRRGVSFNAFEVFIVVVVVVLNQNAPDVGHRQTLSIGQRGYVQMADTLLGQNEL